MKYNFDSITGIDDYEARQAEQWARLQAKYERAGVYCIKLDNKIVYVGKSVNMLTRVFQHKKEIEAAASEKKY